MENKKANTLINPSAAHRAACFARPLENTKFIQNSGE